MMRIYGPEYPLLSARAETATRRPEFLYVKPPCELNLRRRAFHLSVQNRRQFFTLCPIKCARHEPEAPKVSRKRLGCVVCKMRYLCPLRPYGVVFQ
jgi:hypothetical protein